MKRIFQDNKGRVRDFAGEEFTCAKALVDNTDRNVVVIWFESKEGAWFRVFIDGTYCGIDMHSEDASQEDLDDDIFVDDHSDWVAGKKILFAEIKPYDSPGLVMSLELLFDDGSMIILKCLTRDGYCKISFK